MRHYYQSIAIQAVGPVIMAGLTFYLARSLGAAEQGLFYAAKSTFDLIVTCFVFGFPQSIILEINRRTASRDGLYRYAISYSLSVLAVLSIALVLWHPAFANLLSDMLLISFGVSFIVIAFLIRAIYITVDDGPRYSLMTTAPTFFLALTCLLFVGVFDNVSQHVNVIFFWSSLGTACVTYLLARPENNFQIQGNKPSSGKLIIMGLDAFMLSLSANGQIFLTYEFLKACADQSTLGFFSLALTVSNILAFPIQALSPILLNRWSLRRLEHFALPISPWTTVLFGIGALCGAMIFMPSGVSFIAGSEYRPAAIMIQIMIAYTVITAVQRFANLRLAASGNIRFGALVAIGKTALMAIVLYMLSSQVDLRARAGEIVCVAWLLTELIAAIVTVRKVSKNQ